MNKEKHHIFQVVTKRAEKMLEIVSKLDIWENIWLWVTVESNKYTNRIDFLRRTKAKTKFLSLEPLISDLPNLDLNWINWVIVWWESWFWARNIKEDWVLDIKKQCEKQKIPFFFKQWGWVNKKKNWKLLEWKIYNEFPKYSY
jgi:protein gp37